MISLPNDFSAVQVSPASSIAPKELIGNVNFPQLLGGFQTSAATTKTASGQGTPLTEAPLLETTLSKATRDFAAGPPPAMQASGKALPPFGTSLPFDQTAARNGQLNEGRLNKGGADEGGTGLMPQPGVRLEEDAVDAGPEPLTQQGFVAMPLANTIEGAAFSNLTKGGAGEPMPDRGLRSAEKLEEIAGRADKGSGFPIPQSRGTAEPAPPVTGPTNAEEKPAPAIPLQTAAAPRSVLLDADGANADLSRSSAKGMALAAKAPEPLANPATLAGTERGDTTGAIERGDSFAPSTIRGGATRAGLEQASAPDQLKVETVSFDTGMKTAPASTQTLQPPAEPNAGPRPDISAAQLAQMPVQAPPLARGDALPSRLGPTPDLRAQADPSAKRGATGTNDVTQGLAANLLQPAILNLGESDADPDLSRASQPVPQPAPHPSGQPSGQPQPQTSAHSAPQSAHDTAAPQTPVSGLQVTAVPVNAQPSTPLQMSDPSAALRLAPQLENAIEQLAETRSAAQANRPELTLRHQEFGAITMRLDTTGGDLRATLSARDPGFVPAIQAALTERAVAMSSEAANAGRNNDQTGSNSQSQSNSQSSSSSGSHANSQGHGQGQGQGQGWNSGTAYGSSTGSGQGTSQPYTGQTDSRDEESGLDAGARRMGGGDGSEGDGEIFA